MSAWADIWIPYLSPALKLFKWHRENKKKVQLTLNPSNANMLTNAVFVSYFISLGDGNSFVTRLVQIDPEQANSVLQQNGKRPVLLFFPPSF